MRTTGRARALFSLIKSTSEVTVGLRSSNILNIRIGSCCRVVTLREQGIVDDSSVIFKFSFSTAGDRTVSLLVVNFKGSNSTFLTVTVKVSFLLSRKVCFIRVERGTQ